ncbi:Nucleic-acid-binding protein from transposon X-element [Eumeta japonica]|uniref:Nucleic-acid-binding protein from transposon X-element n=1 Tax=Eumeta variegata TaxID=151549 RepID=A0A4C1UIP7_EUMVA|nr:Nucleic-acid-binding protein from transposon X-element [Eumeta japonica]
MMFLASFTTHISKLAEISMYVHLHVMKSSSSRSTSIELLPSYSYQRGRQRIGDSSGVKCWRTLARCSTSANCGPHRRNVLSHINGKLNSANVFFLLLHISVPLKTLVPSNVAFLCVVRFVRSRRSRARPRTEITIASISLSDLLLRFAATAPSLAPGSVASMVFIRRPVVAPLTPPPPPHRLGGAARRRRACPRVARAPPPRRRAAMRLTATRRHPLARARLRAGRRRRRKRGPPRYVTARRRRRDIAAWRVMPRNEQVSVSVGKNKRNRKSSSSSDEDATGTSSDSTVVGTDESESESGKSSSKTDDSFTLVKGKNQNQVRKAQKKSKLEHSSPVPVMEVAMPEKATSATPETMIVDPSPGPITTSTQVETERVAHAGAKPSAPPKGKIPPPIYLLKGANFVRISADCTRLRINYTKAVRVAEDGIRITCPDVQTFRSLNKYLIDSKVKFHTYALEEERKLKAVIRGIPADFDTNDIKTDLLNQGFPVQSVHRLCKRGFPCSGWCWLYYRGPRKLGLFSRIFRKFAVSGIRVEARVIGGPGQCHRCQRYGHAAANCHADPRCVKCLVPHWTRGARALVIQAKPECVNCASNIRPTTEGGAKPSRDAPAAFRPAPAPPPIRGRRELLNRRAPPRGRWEAQRSPVPAASNRDRGFIIVWRRHSNGDAVLRAVSSSEIAEFANQLRACRNVEENSSF